MIQIYWIRIDNYLNDSGKISSKNLNTSGQSSITKNDTDKNTLEFFKIHE